MLEKMDEIEWDSDKWVIETDQNDWAERIDGADKTYRTPRKLMVGIDGNYKDNGIDGSSGTNRIHGIMAWKLMENGINHIDRSDETNGIGEADRFNGAVWTRR